MTTTTSTLPQLQGGWFLTDGGIETTLIFHDGVLADAAPWKERLRGVRANASTCSHAELDAMTELDAGDPADLAARYRDLRASLPQLNVLGGCCGTDHRHVEAIARAWAAA